MPSPHRFANFLTLSRIALVPPFLAFLMSEGGPGPISRTLLVYMVLSDLLDGPVARRSGADNPVGRFLDPLADKLMVGLGYIVLSFKLGLIPSWLTALILWRFVLIRGLWGLVFLTSGMGLGSFLKLGNALTKPNWLGKAAADAQMGLFLVVFFPSLSFLHTAGVYIVAVLTASSGIYYLILSARAVRDTEVLLRPQVRWRCLGRAIHRVSSTVAGLVWGDAHEA
ncbi:MAG TPA: CDP-alcohol phosphatidyltransferase family protein [Candidatus Latescibacteria bacterium]|nr:CDP-alcohol phosphatidyltransferase family protein [Candidatus Latescibacterota bacterium]